MDERLNLARTRTLAIHQAVLIKLFEVRIIPVIGHKNKLLTGSIVARAACTRAKIIPALIIGGRGEAFSKRDSIKKRQRRR